MNGRDVLIEAHCWLYRVPVQALRWVLLVPVDSARRGKPRCVKEPCNLDKAVSADTEVDSVRHHLRPIALVPVGEVEEPLVSGAYKGAARLGIPGFVWAVDEQVHARQEIPCAVITGAQ